MRHARIVASHPRTPAGLAALLFLVCGLTAFRALPAAATPPPSVETRALWVLHTSLTSPQAIADMVDAARTNGFNTLFVQVRGRGDAYFLGGLEPRPADLQRQPATFDPLATVLAAAHAAGLRVQADLRNEKINYKVREHSLAKVPALLAVGKKEAADNTVSIRRLGKEGQQVVPLEQAIAMLVDEATPPDVKRMRKAAA